MSLGGTYGTISRGNRRFDTVLDSAFKIVVAYTVFVDCIARFNMLLLPFTVYSKESVLVFPCVLSFQIHQCFVE